MDNDRASHEDWVQTERIAHFEVVRPVGSGGMGKVFEASDLRKGRTVALKAFNQNMFGAHGLSYIVNIYRRIQHRNIVAFNEGDPFHTPPYISMDFVHGASLSSIIKAKGPLSLSASVRIAFEISEAFSYLHDQGLVRSDLKPANVLLADDGRVFVCDFDTTYDKNAAPPPYGDVVIGTPAYMAPEQFASRPPTGSVDIYAFGVLLYEMTKGHTPWPFDGNVNAIMRAQQQGISQDEEESLGKLYPIIAKCLRPEPSARFSSFAQISFDLWTLNSEPLGA